MARNRLEQKRRDTVVGSPFIHSTHLEQKTNKQKLLEKSMAIYRNALDTVDQEREGTSSVFLYFLLIAGKEGLSTTP